MSDFSNFPSLFNEDDLRSLQRENIDIEDIMKQQLRELDLFGEEKRKLTQHKQIQLMSLH